MSRNFVFPIRSGDIQKKNKKPDFWVCGNQVYFVS